MLRAGIRKAAGAALVTAVLGLSPLALAQPAIPEAGSVVRVTTAAGDTIAGALVEIKDDAITVESPTIGRVAIPVAELAAIDILPPEVAPRYTPPPPPPPPAEKWSGSINFGLTGQSGNTERVSAVGSILARREIPNEVLSFSLRHLFERTDGNTNENRGEFTGRNEWRIGDTRWDFFLQGRAEWDEFKDYDLRLSMAAGFGYRFIDEEETYLRGYAGAGAAREIGGNRNEFIPEALVGFEFWHQLAENIRWSANGEIYPDLDDLGEFRAFAQTSIDIALSDPQNLVLRVGVRNDYVSMTDRDSKNDFFYFATIGYAF